MALKESTLKETFINNTFDDKSIHHQIRKTLESSYEYSRQQQKESIVFDIFHLKTKNSTPENVKYTGDLYVDKAGRACFDINYDFIGVTKRESYRRSNFYMKELNHTTLNTRQDLFDKFPIILIDNHTISEFKVKILNDAITIILPFKADFVLDRTWNKQKGQYNYIDHTMQVLFIKSSYISSFRTNLFQIESMGQGLFFNRVEKTMFDPNPYTSKGTYFAMVHTDTSISGSKLLDVTIDEDYYIIDFDNETKNAVQNVYFTITLLFVEDLHIHTFFEGTEFSQPSSLSTKTGKPETTIISLNTEWDNTTELKMLNANIPVDHLLIMKRDKVTYQNGGYSSFDIINTDGIINEYYPNIFQINSGVTIDDVYKIYYFYKDLKNDINFPFKYFFDEIKSKDNSISFECLIQLYFFSSENSAEINDFNKILNYQGISPEYSITDFVKNKSVSMNSLEYNIDTLKKYIGEDSDVLRDYVILENKATTDNYFLYTKSIDLTLRLRNSTDVVLEHQVVFSTPMYVFMLHTNVNKISNVRIFVDGIFVTGVHHDVHKYMEYIYIPQSYITADSFIEIEVFKDYQFSEELHFDTMDSEVELTLTDISDRCYPMFSDLTFVNTKDHEIITSNFFQISRKNMEYIETVECPIIEDMSKKTRHSFGETFIIKPVETGDNYVVENPISVIIEKSPSVTELTIATSGPLLLRIPNINIGLSDFSAKQYARVFLNGRLLSHDLYDIYVDEGLYIQTNFNCTIGDILAIDSTPFQYSRVGVIQNIETMLVQPNVFDIDLSDFITKPFDLDYFDLYLNGRKLSNDNVVEYDGFHILLTNIKSYSTLEIYERSRDIEYFGIDFGSKKYYYSITDLMNTLSDSAVASYQLGIINNKSMDEHVVKVNVYNDTPNKVVNQYYRESMHKYCFYVNEYINSPYCNPNEKTINQDMLINLYGSLYEKSVRIENNQPALLINPDDITVGDADGEKWLYEIGGTSGYDIPSNFINVLNHGVRPDITDIQRINSIIDTLINRYSNSTLYFPPGNYYLDEQLYLMGSTTIIGSQNDTHFIFIGSEESEEPMTAISLTESSHIKNITIHTDDKYESAVSMYYTSGASVEYCDFTNVNNIGISVIGSIYTRINNNTFDNQNTGISITSEETFSSHLQIQNNTFKNITNDCIFISTVNEFGNLNIIENVFLNSSYAIRGFGSLLLINPTIIKNTFENIDNGISINGAYLLACKDNTFIDILDYGIDVTNTERLLVSNNTFNNTKNAIDLLHAVDAMVKGNTINIFTGIGINIDGTSSVHCKYNTIESGGAIYTGIKINSNGASIISRNKLTIDSIIIGSSANGNTIIHKINESLVNNSVLSNTITTLQIPNIVNVKTFGAVGDGLVDDTTSILSAIATLAENSVLLFPKGIYVIKSDITITNKNNITILCENAIIQGHLNSIVFSGCHNLELNNSVFRDFCKISLNNCNNTDIVNTVFKNFKETSLIVSNSLVNDFFFISDSGFVYSGINEYFKNLGGTVWTAGSDIRFQLCNITKLFIVDCIFQYASGAYTISIETKSANPNSISNLFIADNTIDSTAYRGITFINKIDGHGVLARNKIYRCGEINKTTSGSNCYGINAVDLTTNIEIIGNIIKQTAYSCIVGRFKKIILNTISEPEYKSATHPVSQATGIYGRTPIIKGNLFLNIPKSAIANTESSGNIPTDILISHNIFKNFKVPALGVLLHTGTVATNNAISFINNMIENYEKIILNTPLTSPKLILGGNSWIITNSFGKPQTVIENNEMMERLLDATKEETIFTNCNVSPTSTGIYTFTENITPGSTSAQATIYFDLSNAVLFEDSSKLTLYIESEFETNDTKVILSSVIKNISNTDINNVTGIVSGTTTKITGFCEIDTSILADITNTFGIRLYLANNIGGHTITVNSLTVFSVLKYQRFYNIDIED